MRAFRIFTGNIHHGAWEEGVGEAGCVFRPRRAYTRMRVARRRAPKGRTRRRVPPCWTCCSRRIPSLSSSARSAPSGRRKPQVAACVACPDVVRRPGREPLLSPCLSDELHVTRGVLFHRRGEVLVHNLVDELTDCSLLEGWFGVGTESSGVERRVGGCY